VKDFRADASGATAIEYALIASLISMVIIAGATSVGTQLSGFFTSVSSNLK
jgi:pilus assembly protein Flp/PilA